MKMIGSSKPIYLSILFRFDVVLAPELISMDEEEFEQLHELLDLALSPNGIM